MKHDIDEKVTGTSLDISAENREKLRQLLPSVFTEVINDKGEVVESIDFEKLKAELGTFSEYFENRKEHYGMDWPGKKDAHKLIQISSASTLKPCRGESVNFDTTENLFIEGDNLEVLKLLQKSYYGKVRMLYIDPPYNTEGDFIYPDKYTENIETYLRYTDQLDDQGRKYSTVTEEDGRYHSRWLSMMFPRLYLARNLMSDDGVIVIHIDEHEVNNLKILMDQIFGPENDLGTIIWDKKNPKGDSTKIASQHESIIVYAKSIGTIKEKVELIRPKVNASKILEKSRYFFSKIGKLMLPIDLELVKQKYALDIECEKFKKIYDIEDARKDFKDWLSSQEVSGGEAAYNQIDDKGDVYQAVSMAWPNKKKAPDEYFIPLVHPITKKECSIPDRGWRNPPETMKTLMADGKIIFGEDESTQPRRKYLLKDNLFENIPSVLPFGGSDDSLLKRLGIPFDNPKPVNLVKSLISYFTKNEGIVIDFFAGSGTVGHAAFLLQEEGNGIQFILVQLPEKLDSNKIEHKPGIDFCIKNNLKQNISEISKERLRRAYKETKLADQNSSGFKVLKLDKSNFKQWQKLEPGSAPEKIAEQLELHVDHVNKAATQEDLLYEVLIKAGFMPTEKIETKEIAGKQVFSIADGSLLICFEQDITKEVIEAVAGSKPMQFICLDSAFGGNDQLKANAVQTFRALNQGKDKEEQILFKTI